jgi:hypothetical protein
MESTAACLFPRSGVTAPIADPFVSLNRRSVCPFFNGFLWAVSNG